MGTTFSRVCTVMAIGHRVGGLGWAFGTILLGMAVFARPVRAESAEGEGSRPLACIVFAQKSVALVEPSPTGELRMVSPKPEHSEPWLALLKRFNVRIIVGKPVNRLDCDPALVLWISIGKTGNYIDPNSGMVLLSTPVAPMGQDRYRPVGPTSATHLGYQKPTYVEILYRLSGPDTKKSLVVSGTVAGEHLGTFDPSRSKAANKTYEKEAFQAAILDGFRKLDRAIARAIASRLLERSRCQIRPDGPQCDAVFRLTNPSSFAIEGRCALDTGLFQSTPASADFCLRPGESRDLEFRVVARAKTAISYSSLPDTLQKRLEFQQLTLLPPAADTREGR